MTDAANHKNLASYVSHNPPKRNGIVKKVGNLRHIFDAILNGMYESRRRQAEQEMANFVARQGGRMTDDLEREMARRLFTSDWSPRERKTATRAKSDTATPFPSPPRMIHIEEFVPEKKKARP